MSYAQSRNRVINTAIAAAQMHQAGHDSYTAGEGVARQEFDLDTGGMCARFVRQAHETALGLAPFGWEFASPTAHNMATKLRHSGELIDTADRVPGDIVQIGARSPGHIAIYVGEVDGVDCIAENTSDKTRGNPRKAGTKLTPWSAISDRVAGVFRVPEVAEPTGITVVREAVDADPLVLTRAGSLVDGTVLVPLREIAEALGYLVTDHVQDQGKVYLTAGG